MDFPTVVQLLIFGLTNGAVVALNAVGFTLAYAVARQINLAHGNVFALATVAVASLAATLGVTAATPPAERVAALLALMVAGTLFGAVLNVGVERLAFRPFRSGDRLAPLIATVGLSFVLLQTAIWWHLMTSVPRPGHQGVSLPLLAVPDLLPRVELGGAGVSFTLKDALVLALGAAVAGGGRLLLAGTKAGRLLRAVAEDPQLAALCGADARRARTLAFAVAGALAGFGASIFAAYYGGASAQHGLRSGLAIMTAAVLGGVGDPRGALVGGLTLGIVASFSDYLLDARWTPVLTLGLLIGLLALRRGGLVGAVGGPGAVDDGAGVVVEAGRSQCGAGHARRRRWLFGALLALGLVYPLLDQGAGWSRLHSATTMLLLVTLAVGLSIVVRLAGLLDLGYAAFFGIGGYTAALLSGSGSRLAPYLPAVVREPWLALPLAGLTATGFGLLFGLPSVRTRGEYLAIVTLAFGELVPGVLWQLEWTGGPRGISGVPGPALGPWPVDSPLHAYLLALALAAVGCLAAARLTDSRTGRAWAAVRDDDVAAGSIGVHPARARLLAFAIGAGYAGLAGAVAAGQVGYVDPEHFGLSLSLMLLAAVVLGSGRGLLGVVLAALLVAAYDRLVVEALNAALQALGGAAGLEALARADLRGHTFAVFGLGLYLAILVRSRFPVRT